MPENDASLVDCPECLGGGRELFTLAAIEDGHTPDNMPKCGVCSGTGKVTPKQARAIARDEV